MKAVSALGILIEAVVSGPKKPNDELSESKIITAAASNYKAKNNTFSPDVDPGKFKVFEASTASAEFINSSAKVLSAEFEKEENRPLQVKSKPKSSKQIQPASSKLKRVRS